MRNLSRGIWGCIFLCLMPAWVQADESLSKEQIRRAVANVYRYEFGSSRRALMAVEELVAQTHNQPEMRDCLAEELGRLLVSDATLAAKDFACRQFQSVQFRSWSPAQFELLHHEDTVEMACYAIVDQESDTVNPALRQALGQLQGLSLVAVLNLLGDRRDADSVSTVAKYVEDSDATVADAAIAALGKIASDQASHLLREMLVDADSPRRPAAALAYLQAGRELAARGETEKSRQIYDQLIEEKELLHVRRGALLGKIALGEPEAVPLILRTLEGDDECLKPAALAAASKVPGRDVTSLLVQRLNQLSADNKVLLIQALVDRGNQAILPVLVQSLESDLQPVRIAAIRGLATMGSAATVAPLCHALGKAQTQAEVDAIQASLQEMEGEQVSHAILDAIGDASPSTKTQLIRIITSRDYSPAVPQLLVLCRSDATPVAQAAFRAIGMLASYREMPQLLDMFVDPQHQALQTQVLRAVIAVVDRSDEHRDDIARLIQERLDCTKDVAARRSLLQVLPVVPGESSLRRLTAASEDSDPSIRDTAIRTLARYPDPAAIDALLKVFQTSTDSGHRAVALRGCVRLLKTGKVSSERAIAVYEQLVAHIDTPAERRLVLSGLAVVQHPTALKIVEGLMDDDDVKAEAALALKAIADNTPTTVGFNDDATALNGKTGGVKLVDSPIAGKALSLNGADARIELPHTEAWSVGSDDFTVALWVHPESLKQAGILCVGGYNWRHGWLIDVHPNGSVRLETANTNHSDNGSVRTSGGVLTPGRWAHVAIVAFRGDNARIFINGHEKARGEVAATDLTNPEANVVIGGIENKNQYNFHGQLDEVAIYKRSLTEDEIQVLVEPGQKVLAAQREADKKLRQKSPAMETARSGGGVARSLFDGKTFAGWEGELEFFRIEQGAIVAGSLDKRVPYNVFLATTREYGDFELTLKTRLVGEGDNAGIQFRSCRIPGSHEMIGYQADMGHDAGKNIWASLYDESRRGCFLAEADQTELAQVFRTEGWNEFTIRCVGPRVQIWLNGYQAIDYTESDGDIERQGMIGLQIHGGAPSEAWYKDITIKEL